MFKLISFCAIASLVVAYVAATCLMCPAALSDDTQLPVCASNAYGTFNVTQSSIANWNCIHPNNPYTVISNTTCPFVKNNCGLNTCAANGTAVCARQDGVGRKHKGYSTAVFANLCQLMYYNCVFPTKPYKQVTNIFDFECKALTF